MDTPAPVLSATSWPANRVDTLKTEIEAIQGACQHDYRLAFPQVPLDRHGQVRLERMSWSVAPYEEEPLPPPVHARCLNCSLESVLRGDEYCLNCFGEMAQINYLQLPEEERMRLKRIIVSSVGNEPYQLNVYQCQTCRFRVIAIYRSNHED